MNDSLGQKKDITSSNASIVTSGETPDPGCSASHATARANPARSCTARPLPAAAPDRSARRNSPAAATPAPDNRQPLPAGMNAAPATDTMQPFGRTEPVSTLVHADADARPCNAVPGSTQTASFMRAAAARRTALAGDRRQPARNTAPPPEAHAPVSRLPVTAMRFPENPETPARPAPGHVARGIRHG